MKNIIRTAFIFPRNSTGATTIQNFCIEHLIPYLETEQEMDNANWNSLEKRVLDIIENHPGVMFCGVGLRGQLPTENCMNACHDIYAMCIRK